MGVKQVFKETQLGIVPVDWNIDIISNHASINTGSRNTQDRIKDGIYPFFVRSSTIERINSFSYDGEAVLTAGDGVRTGKVFHYIKGKFDFHQRVYKISDFSKELDGYFFYLIFCKHFYNRIMSMTAKSSVDSVRMDMIAEMEIPIPPLLEQRSIAEVMIDIDDLIVSLNFLIAKKRDIKKGAMQQLLTGKKRLPGFDIEWNVKRLGEIVDINMGQSPDSTYYNESEIGLPLIQGNADIKKRKSIKRIFTTQITKTCEKGDLILTVRAPVGYIGIASEQSCIGRGVCSLKTKHIFPAYLFHTLVLLENKWKSIEQGSTFTAANSYQIADFPLLVSEDVDEQKAIAEILSDMDAEITSLKDRRKKTLALKKGLMKVLLTGRIRLI